jgi:hypothetical protein
MQILIVSCLFPVRICAERWNDGFCRKVIIRESMMPVTTLERRSQVRRVSGRDRM